MLHDLENPISDRRSLAARLLDRPGMTWTLLGALIRTAAAESSANTGADQAARMVAQASAVSGGDAR